MRTLSLDIETTHVKPALGSILSIGLQYAVFNKETGNISYTKSFYGTVHQDLYSGDPYALAMNAEVLKYIADSNSGKAVIIPEADVVIKKDSILDLWDSVIEFVDSLNLNEVDKLTLLGKNLQGFDLYWLGYHLNKDLNSLLKDLKSGRRICDVATCFVLPSDEVLPDLTTCIKRSGLNKEVSHNALEDAQDVTDLFAHILTKNAK